MSERTYQPSEPAASQRGGSRTGNRTTPARHGQRVEPFAGGHLTAVGEHENGPADGSGPPEKSKGTSRRKQVLLRLHPQMYDALARWASDELRSTNAQIEYVLRAALADAGRLPGTTQRPVAWAGAEARGVVADAAAIRRRPVT